jgi:hypothetical protein
METDTSDDHLPATKGELRALTAGLEATNARIDATNADLNKLMLEMRSTRTGVEQAGPIIPAAETVVEEESRFSRFTQAVLRHKGYRAKIVLVLTHSKKRV